MRSRDNSVLLAVHIHITILHILNLAKHCPSVGPYNNSIVSSNNSAVGEKVAITCKAGYQRPSNSSNTKSPKSEVLECLSSQVWNSYTEDCQRRFDCRFCYDEIWWFHWIFEELENPVVADSN